MESLDRIDLSILALLQQDGRITNQELAERVSLSTAPCLRRVRRLEELGYIERYVAVVNRAALGLNVMALVSVSLNSFTDAGVRAFESFIESNAHITECYSVSGEYDFQLKIVASSMQEVESILLKQLLRLDIVRNATTNFVLGERKNTTVVPVS
ncbi:MAG: Lrp/AsnC family transcriptional regulator [Pseudomonadales bacterium]